jgi:DNA-binding transcriptional LysR family regulator
MAINELRAIETFAKAVELGSIRRAAVAQGVTPQAASQTLAQLEQHLGMRLLHRTTRSLALTEEGRRLLESTQPALEALQRALHSAREAKDEIAGPLRIVGPRSSFAPVLMPVIDEFCRLYPDVQPDIQLDDGIGNWVNDRVDVGFRIGRSAEEGVVARRLFPVQLFICAAPAYLERHGVPQSLDDLASHRCSAFRHPATGQVIAWYVNIDGEIVNRHVVPALSTNDTELEVQAVLAGLVIGQVSNLSVAEHIRHKRLVPLLLQHVSEHIGVHVYYGHRTAQPRRVRAFIDLAVQRLLDCPRYVVTKAEMREAQAGFKRARRR